MVVREIGVELSLLSKLVFKLGGTFLAVILVGGIASTSQASQAARKGPKGHPDAVPGEIIIKYRPGVSERPAFINARLKELGVSEVRRLSGSLSEIGIFKTASAAGYDDVLAELNEDPEIEFAQPNYVVTTPSAEGRDVSGLPLECLLRPGIVCGHGIFLAKPRPVLKPRPSEVSPPQADPMLKEVYSVVIAHAAEAWSVSRGSDSVIVGVVDSGIDYNHEDLAFNMWRNPTPGPMNDIVGYDFLSNNGEPYDDDEMKGHGTHAAGIIGAVGGNGKGLSGVNQRVSLMALKSFSAYGYGTTESVVAAIGYAMDHGAKIVSNSFASGKKDNPVVIDTIEKARAKGVLLAFAAGNSAGDDDNDETANYPAGYRIDNIVAVASTDPEDQLASSSNYGATTVLLAAPGVNIYSTLPGSKYGWQSGTSMACPFVAGTAAQIWARHPTWSYLQVRKALHDSVDVLTQLSGKVISGGRVNVFKALQVTE